MSLIAWVDTSVDEQRRIHEIVQAFTDPNTLDELGIGQVRDSFSDELFPGTSTIQTRARYFLFVPWLFQRAARNSRDTAILPTAERYERQLIGGIRTAGHTRGLIGLQAGAAVKRLPSSVYWSGLQRYGILTHPMSRDQVGRSVTSRAEATEIVDRAASDWHATLPPQPKGLPHHVPNGFDMTYDEASWLQERIVSSEPDSHLAHLVTRPHPPEPSSATPWEDPSAFDATEENQRLLHDADLFSLGMHGASLLYNILLADKYERAGHTKHADAAAAYREDFRDWSEIAQGRLSEFQQWDLTRLWAVPIRQRRRISSATRWFITGWLQAVASEQAFTASDDSDLRTLIANRERATKGNLARLHNAKMLSTWSGASGNRALVYRWPQVRVIVTDILAGTHRAGS